MTTISILLVDDYKMVREGLKIFIAPIPDFKVAGEACDGREAVDLVARLHPDVILMDLVMPNLDGIEAARQICQRDPQAHILMITSFAEDERVMGALQAGAAGYLLKDSSPEELEAAIRAVYRRESYLPPSIAHKVIRNVNRPTASHLPLDALTPRERDVLKMVATGKTNNEIAQELYLSAWTVRSHLWRIMKKMNVENRTQLALAAIRSGSISLNC